MTSVENIQNLITQFIENQDFMGTPSELYAPIEYTMSQKGKRMRPTLALLSCEMFGGDIDECMKPAVAAEIFHYGRGTTSPWTGDSLSQMELQYRAAFGRHHAYQGIPICAQYQ